MIWDLHGMGTRLQHEEKAKKEMRLKAAMVEILVSI